MHAITLPLKSDLIEILLCLTPDDFTRQNVTYLEQLMLGKVLEGVCCLGFNGIVNERFVYAAVEIRGRCTECK